jgi:hypothetical protein
MVIVTFAAGIKELEDVVAELGILSIGHSNREGKPPRVP